MVLDKATCTWVWVNGRQFLKNDFPTLHQFALDTLEISATATDCERTLVVAGSSSALNLTASVTTYRGHGVFESLVGFRYYRAACLIGGGEVPGLSTRPAVR
jgi:hypothetical protein